MTEDDRRYVLIGTAGHIDHGKTALVKMLTGCETDTLKEEKERGLTIDLGFAPCELRGDLMACIVDVPGHEKFIRNMVAGASGIDAVLLVVAADDSVMPQTIEHLRIVELLGIRRGLVAVTKIDMVDEELRDLVVEEVRDFLADTFLAQAPICPVSSITGEGFENLWIALTEMVDACEDRPVEGIFRMPVERVFSVKGYGTVITGMPPSGSVAAGDRLELLPQRQIGRLRGMQVYGKDSDRGWAGQCLALNVADVDHNSLERGNVLADPGYLQSVKMFSARLHLLPGAERKLKHQAPVRFHTGTSEVIGRVFFLDRERLDPGESALIQFRGEDPLVVAPGDRFVIRQYSPVVTIGGGRILQPDPRKVKRFREGTIRRLQALEEVLDDQKGFVAHLLEGEGSTPVNIDDLRTRAYLPTDRLQDLLVELVADGRAVRLGNSESFLSTVALGEAREKVRRELAGFHETQPLRKGMDLHALRKSADLDPAVAEEAVGALVGDGEITREEGLLALASHGLSFSPEQKARAERLREILREAAFGPPLPAALAADVGAPEPEVRDLLAALADRGEAVRIGEDLYAHPDAESRARDLLVTYLRREKKIGVVDYRDLLCASRKYVYAWLDHFDALGLTYRVENFRYLREGAAPAK